MTKQEVAIKELKKLLKANDTTYVIQRRVSSSGMSRLLDLYIFKKNKPLRITYQVAEVLGWSIDRATNYLRVNGAGMDMHFHTVYSLGQVLFKDGYKLTHQTI